MRSSPAWAATRYGFVTFPEDEHQHLDGWDYWWGAADLVTTDVDDNDKPFLTGERTAEGEGGATDDPGKGGGRTSFKLRCVMNTPNMRQIGHCAPRKVLLRL
jgi:hypothetical protein